MLLEDLINIFAEAHADCRLSITRSVTTCTLVNSRYPPHCHRRRRTDGISLQLRRPITWTLYLAPQAARRESLDDDSRSRQTPAASGIGMLLTPTRPCPAEELVVGFHVSGGLSPSVLFPTSADWPARADTPPLQAGRNRERI